MNPSPPVRLAVIGAGHLGRIHARLASDLEDATLVGVVDPVAAVRNQVARDAQTTPYASHTELLGQIDAAVVAAPTKLHHQVALDLIRAGVHLLVEKPLAASLAEANELVDEAQRQGVVLQTGHVERFNPALERLLTEVGKPKYIESVRMSGYPFRSADVGVVLDLMIHDLDIVLHLADAPLKRVDALGLAVIGPHEDVARARLEFEGGCVADLTASRVSYTSQRTMQLWTAEGFGSVDFATRSTTVVRPCEGLRDGTLDVHAIEPEERAHLQRHFFEELLVKESVEGAEGNPLLEEQRDLVHAVRHGISPRVTGAQGRDVLAAAEQVLAAIDAHAWDDDSASRINPQVLPAAPILRGPHWDQATARARKEAG